MCVILKLLEQHDKYIDLNRKQEHFRLMFLQQCVFFRALTWYSIIFFIACTKLSKKNKYGC